MNHRIKISPFSSAVNNEMSQYCKMAGKCVKHVVVDSGGFILNAPISVGLIKFSYDYVVLELF